MNNTSKNRSIESNYAGVKVKRWLNHGSPQGGCLSPTYWNCVFNELLDSLNTEGNLAVGFADDGAILITGNDLPFMATKMQRCLDKATSWGHRFGLQFSAEKTVSMIFRPAGSRRAPPTLPPLHIGGGSIQTVNSVKYLGITLDSSLSFRTHIKNKIAQCKALTSRLNHMVAAHYGPVPIHVHKLYMGAVLPILSYGCHVWQHKLNNAQKTELRSLNHRAALIMTGGFQNSPTEALQVLLNPPRYRNTYLN